MQKPIEWNMYRTIHISFSGHLGVPSVIFLYVPAMTAFAMQVAFYFTACLHLFIFDPWRPVLAVPSIVFLAVPGCEDLCLVCRVLYAPAVPSFVFLPMPTVPGCDDLCRVCGLLYFWLCQLWPPAPGMQRRVLYLDLCQAVTTCTGYVDCQFFYLYASCDDLCWVYRGLFFCIYASCADRAKCCFSTYANCARLWWPMPGYVNCYISTNARLGRPVPIMQIVIFLSMPAVTPCVGYTEGLIYFVASSCARPAECCFSVYANCTRLRQLCQVCWLL